MNKEKLRKFHFPVPRVPVKHAAPDLDEIMTEYWVWDGEWRNCNDWYLDPAPEVTAQWREPITKDNPATTRGIESEHAWKCLLEMAKLFGYIDN